MSSARGLLCSVVLLLLAACATPLPPEPVDDAPPAPPTDAELFAAHQQRLRHISDWEARGKVAYRLPDDAGSASLHWTQQGAGSALRLAGPFGAGAVRIRTEGPLLRIERDGIERLYPADAAPWLGGEQLLPIPLTSLQHWLRGLPDPTAELDALELENGLARRIVQSGWTLQYDDYRDRAGIALPGRLTIAMPAASLSLRVLLRRWELPPGDTSPGD